MKNTANPFNSFAEMLSVLHDEKTCREFLELMRWGGSPRCPHCGFNDHYVLKTKGEFRGMYKCKNCKERYTITVGTMFEGSHIPLRKWFIAIYLFSSHKKGISSHQLAKDLGITQKSAWFVLGRIRYAFKVKSINLQMTGLIQADETFVGGKNKNRHEHKKVKESQGRSTKDKTPVFGLLEQDGKLKLQVVSDTKAKTLKPIIQEMVKKGAIVVTDEWGAYNGLAKDYSHQVVKHNDKEFVKDNFHTNGIENFWSLFKRGIYGIYHHASPKHLHRYTDEFAYRFNSRDIKDQDRFTNSLKQVEGRLTYQNLIKP